MRIWLFLPILLIVLPLSLLVLGWLLPPTREGRAEILINAPPSRVLAVIADVEAQPEWRPSVTSVQRDATGWIENTSRGERVTFNPVTMSETRIHLRFNSDAGYSGEWIADLTAELSGTRIAVVERATIPSPLGRLLARAFFDPEAFATTYLQALMARSEGR